MLDGIITVILRGIIPRLRDARKLMRTLSCLRLLELKVGGPETAKTLMEEMTGLNSVLSRYKGAALPIVQIEEPNEIQIKVLTALGYTIKDGSVLQLQN